MRCAVVEGQPRAPGVAALRFHGMWHGLTTVMQTGASALAAPPPTLNPVQVDDQFVRLMANLVLRTHTELTHVY